MLSTKPKSSTLSRSKGRHRLALWTESLELRRLLAATPAVASVMTFAIGLPIASLEAGAYRPVPAESTWQMPDQTTQEIISSELALAPGGSGNIGLATPAQTYQTYQTGVSLPLFESAYGGTPSGISPFGPSPTGPATTLGSGFETAIAPASQVTLPTPGRNDRISSIVRTPPIIPLPHYESPDAPVTQEPEIQEKAPAKPVQPPIQPAQPPDEKTQPPEKAIEPPVVPPTIEAVPAPTSRPVEPRESMSFGTWDAAIDMVETDLPEVTPAVPSSHAEGSMACGILLAAWGGWNYRASRQQQSKRHRLDVEVHEAGPDRGSRF